MYVQRFSMPQANCRFRRLLRVSVLSAPISAVDHASSRAAHPGLLEYRLVGKRQFYHISMQLCVRMPLGASNDEEQVVPKTPVRCFVRRGRTPAGDKKTNLEGASPQGLVVW